MNKLLFAHRASELMIEYLKLKIEAEDWHAVSDAACDLREIEAMISLLDPK